MLSRYLGVYQCRTLLESFRALWPAVDKLLEDKDLKLGMYKFNTAQDHMVEELYLLLEVRRLAFSHNIYLPSLQMYEEITRIFEANEQPLIIEIILAFEQLEFMLTKLSKTKDYLAVTCVAAYGGVLMICRYYLLIDECKA